MAAARPSGAAAGCTGWLIAARRAGHRADNLEAFCGFG